MPPAFLTRRQSLKLAGASLLTASAGLWPRGANAAPVTLADIKKAGVLNAGCDAAYPPYTYRDSSGKLVGYDVDLMQKYVEPLGVKGNMIDTQWAGVIPSLYAGRFEMIPGMTYTKERLERVIFSIPYADASQALLIRLTDKDKIKTIDDMNGKVLAVALGSPGETIKIRLDAALKAKGGAGFSGTKTYDDFPAAYLALAQGSVDAVLHSVPTLSIVLRDRPNTYTMVQNIGVANYIGLAFRKEDAELRDYISGRLEDMKKSGELYALQEKWFGFKMKLIDNIPTFS